MKDQTLKVIRDFLKERALTPAPILIAFSGGPDSTALLHLMMEASHFFPFPVHLAHVDHGWREESKKEADLLKEQALSLEVPFHLHTIKPGDLEDGNLEDQCREIRLLFFKKVYDTIGAQALVMGHQSNDQAETVLKRILEGSNHRNLSGISPVRERDGMEIWRPLLTVSKEEILAWLEKKGISYLEDATNQDEDFLRNRMRRQLFPEVEKYFGKNVQNNLVRLGASFRGLNEYLERRVAKYHQGYEGGMVPYKAMCPFEEIEFKYFISSICQRAGSTITRADLEVLTRLVKEEKAGKQVQTDLFLFTTHSAHLCIKRVESRQPA